VSDFLPLLTCSGQALRPEPCSQGRATVDTSCLNPSLENTDHIYVTGMWCQCCHSTSHHLIAMPDQKSCDAPDLVSAGVLVQEPFRCSWSSTPKYRPGRLIFPRFPFAMSKVQTVGVSLHHYLACTCQQHKQCVLYRICGCAPKPSTPASLPSFPPHYFSFLKTYPPIKFEFLRLLSQSTRR
jgi:hypothetical protein